ncbi:MAG TPA: helix-turn-helix domain-containing protein [Saprospiraceae bacterium]|nr:helix-turn-helix domain-containing protein [Saprospiraceae bacterium]
MQKLTFQRNKYGKEILIDTVHTSEFAVDKMEVLPDFYTIAFLRKAEGKIKINNQTIALKKSIVLIIPVSQMVDISNAEFNEGYFIFFEGEFLDKFFNEQNFIFKFSFFHNTENPLYLQIGSAEKTNIYSLFDEIHHEIRNYQHDSEHLIRAYLYQLLILINRSYTKQYPALNASLMTNNHLLKFRYAIEKEIKAHNNVQYYTDLLGISRTYLNKLCIDFYAKTSIQVIKQRLALEIKKELLFTSKTIAEIAHEYNFSDPANFNRFFKQITSQTPQQFREFSK